MYFKMKYILLFIIYFLCFSYTVKAQDTLPVFSLDECVEMALTHNTKAIIADNNLKEAIALSREAFTKYFPEVAATGLMFWANHDIIQYNVLDIIELGIIKKGKAFGIQAVQPIFLGGQIVNGNKLAKVGEEVAELRRTQTQNELRLTTETLYWKLNTLKSTRETLNSAIATLDTLESQVSIAVDAGLALNNDLLKVKLRRNSYKSELVDLDNGIMLVKMLLSQYIGMGPEGNIEIQEAMTEYDLPGLPYSIYIPANDALPHTTDFRLLMKNIEAKKLERRLEVGKNLPALALGGGWYYHDLFRQNHNFASLQLGLEIPLTGWWGGSYSIKRKDLAIQNATHEMQDLSQQLQIEMQDKWNNLTAAYRKMEIEQEGIRESLENLRLNSLYYEAGMATVTDLLEADTQLKESRERFINALGEFNTSRSAYLIATGR